jgi:hypothetical protein
VSGSSGRAPAYKFEVLSSNPVTTKKKKKNPSQKWVGGVAQGVGPEFTPQYHKKKKKIQTTA